MERRRFLKNLVISAVAVSVPVNLVAGVRNTPANIHYPWKIDYANKHIIYQGGHNEGFTVREFYNFLKSEWEHEKAEFPFKI